MKWFWALIAAFFCSGAVMVGVWWYFVHQKPPPAAPAHSVEPTWVSPDEPSRVLLQAVNQRLQELDLLKLLSQEVETFPREWHGKTYTVYRETFRLPRRFPAQRLAADLDATVKIHGSRLIHQETQKFLREMRHVWGFGSAPGFIPLEVVFREIRGPRAAVVLDDVGYQAGIERDLLYELDIPLTLAIIPGTPYATLFAREAPSQGLEVIAHQPMEGHETVQKGDYESYLTRDLPPPEVRKKVEETLDALPGVRGLSNHMGSEATRDKALMVSVLQVLKERGLYFLDSLTAPESVGEELARKMGVFFAKRQVFLDNDPRSARVVRVIEKTLEKVMKNDEAVVMIGHFRKETLEALRLVVPKWRSAGVEFLYVSEVVE